MEIVKYYTKTKLKERIKTVRKHYKLNQIEFGKKLGVSRDVISNIEQGRVEAKDLIINHICDIYAINKDWLLYGKGNMLKETVENMLQELIKAYDLNSDEIVIIKNYIQLKKEDRQKFASLLRLIAKSTINDDELSINEKVEQVRDELTKSEDTQTSSASTTTNTTNNEKRA